jgi:2-polyprenyl-3-methyl-5-hydroxy-6-metoxy-1,4-benzoquinol methylase
MTPAGLTASPTRSLQADRFEPIATSLRCAVIEHYRRSGERLGPAAWFNTLETNSGFVERRGRPMLELLYSRTGLASLHGLTLLDSGCGFGALAVYFAAQGARVTGIDPHAHRLPVGREVAARHGLDLTLQRGRMERLEFPDETFDVLVMNNSLCYVVDADVRATAVREAFRVLRPGGYVLIRNPNRLVLRDQFSGLPFVTLLPPRTADRATKLMRRHRSKVRLRGPLGARRELSAAGFAEVELVQPPGSRVPGVLTPFARYQHLIAVRPLHG